MTDTTHRVHGLAGDDIAPDWPMLRAGEIDALLQRYPQLGAPGTIRWHSPRPLSAAALVETDAGEVFVKRHHRSVRSPDTLREEHRFMAHLHEAGIPVPAVFASADGSTAVAVEEWTYEIHSLAAGMDVYREAVSWSPLTHLAHARTAGQMLATLHNAAEGYRAPQRSSHILVARSELLTAADPVAVLEAQWYERPGLAGYLKSRDWRRDLADLMAPWQARLQSRLAVQDPLWTHGDWHASNLCWSGTGDGAHITSVLDFGLAATNFALFDLATAIERNAIAWLALDTGNAAAHVDTALALIEGYRRQRPLGAGDVGLLADLLPLVHVDFALSEVEYFHAVLDSRHSADVAYDIFLRGHAAWFLTPAGCRMLAAIRDHA